MNPEVEAERSTPTIEPGSDWRTALIHTAQEASKGLSSRQVSRNPMIPDNFLDLSDAGFPADLEVVSVQIPRNGIPAELGQYRNMVNMGWRHIPWSAISENGGMDGKANVPGATSYEMGAGTLVAVNVGHYLMFADRTQYHKRRALNVERATAHLKYKAEELEEKTDSDRRYANSTDPLRMTTEELLDYESKLHEETGFLGHRGD